MSKTHVNFRLGNSGLAAVDALAAEVGLTRSTVVRMLLAAAMAEPKIVSAIRRTPTQEEK